MKRFFDFLLISVEQLNYEIAHLQTVKIQPELRTILTWLLIIYKQIIVLFALGCNFIIELFLTLLQVPLRIVKFFLEKILKYIDKIQELPK